MGNLFSESHHDFEQSLLQDTTSKKYAVPIPGATADPGYSLPYRNVEALETGLVTSYKYPDGTEVKTMWDLYEKGHDRTEGRGEFLGTRRYMVDPNPEQQKTPENLANKPKSYKPSGYVERADGTILRGDYVWNTYAQARDAAIKLGRGLVFLGSKVRDNIGIFSVNRAEWTITSMAIYSQSFTVAPLYATLGHDSTEYIINHANLGVMVCSFENLPLIAKIAPKVSSVLKRVIVIDCIFDGFYGNTLDIVKPEQVATFSEYGIELLGLSDVIRHGEENENIPLQPPKAEDTAFLMYTSGTTGHPKGVVLTHQNIISVVQSVQLAYPLFEKEDSYASFLPLGHILETLGIAFLVSNGARISFSQGDIRRLSEDLTKINPMLFPAVPRIIERFYQGVWTEVGKLPFYKRWLVNRAYAHQIKCIRANRPLDPTYDQYVFKGIREKLGLGNVKLVLTGAAPCPPALVEFMRVLTNAYFVQGYGMTECAAGAAIQTLDDPHIPDCGPPIHSNDFMLADLSEEMGYSINDSQPRGELLLSGPNIFSGYYRDEENTKDAFYVDSNDRRWYRTGDVARINPNGTVSIIDRKKNIIKLSQGEYVALEKVEQLLGSAPGITQFWVYGSSYKSMLVGMIVPDWQYVYDIAVKNGWWKDASVKPRPGNHSDEFLKMFADTVKEHEAEFTAMYKENIKSVEGSLMGFEKVKAFCFETDIDGLGMAFTEANNTLTPTMKKKRKQLVDKYIDTLKQMYTSLGEPPQDGEKW